MRRLRLVLDVHQSEIQGTESGHFVIGFNTPGKEFWMQSKGQEVFPGQKSNLVLELSRTETEPGLAQSTSIEERRCRYANETLPGQGSLFREYSQEGCLFECRLRHLQRKVKCLPWDMIRFDEDLTFPVCTRNKTTLFFKGLSEAAASQLDEAECGHCLGNCEELVYSASVKTWEVDYVGTCLDDEMRARMFTYISKSELPQMALAPSFQVPGDVL